MAMENGIDISGLNKAAVLTALYNAAKPQGWGWIEYSPAPLTIEQAERLLDGQTYFDYVQGRVLKVNLAGDAFDPWLYDRDNGQGAARRAIDGLKSSEQDMQECELHEQA